MCFLTETSNDCQESTNKATGSGHGPKVNISSNATSSGHGPKVNISSNATSSGHGPKVNISSNATTTSPLPTSRHHAFNVTLFCPEETGTKKVKGTLSVNLQTKEC